MARKNLALPATTSESEPTHDRDGAKPRPSRDREDGFQLSQQDHAIGKAIDADDGLRYAVGLESTGRYRRPIEYQFAAPARISAAIKARLDGEIPSEIDEMVRDKVIEQICRARCWADAVRARWTATMSADLVEDMDAPEREGSHCADESDRAAVEQSLTYPEYSAGRLMQSEVVTAPEH